MKTLGDHVLENTKTVSSTTEAILALGLEDVHKNNRAGNIYLASLFIIKKQNERIDKLVDLVETFVIENSDPDGWVWEKESNKEGRKLLLEIRGY